MRSTGRCVFGLHSGLTAGCLLALLLSLRCCSGLQTKKYVFYVDSVPLYRDPLVKAFGEEYITIKCDVWHRVNLLQQALEASHSLREDCISDLWRVLLVPDADDVALATKVLGHAPSKDEKSRHVRSYVPRPEQLVPALQDFKER